VLPAISPIGRRFGLMTQADLVEHIYDSRVLGILVAIVSVCFLLPYLQLQLTGLGLIIEACSYGVIPRVPAMIIAFGLVATFVSVSGLKGVAATAVIKDSIMIIAVVFFGLFLPIHYFGSLGGTFAALETAKPGFMVLPGATKNLDVSWMMSTIALTSLGFYMWPHLTANSFSARNPEVLRHNAVYLPLYQLCMIFPMLIGFIALVRHTFPGWALGLVGGAGALACMIPAADLLLSTSMVFSRNVYGRIKGGDIPAEQLGRLAKQVVIGLALIALALSILFPNMLVNLLLTGYAGVTQFFPLLVLGVFWKRAHKYAAYCGLAVGEFIVFYTILNHLDPLPIWGLNINAGFTALCVNMVVFVVLSLVFAPQRSISPYADTQLAESGVKPVAG
jgi:SSS family solute:Na+ symporter